MQLPESTELDISRLARVFADTTNSYKFYWLLAILDDLKENDRSIISLNDLALRMVANVWYPLDYFKLSFGSQDGFKPIADFVSARMVVDHSKNSLPVFEQLTTKLTHQELATVYKMVDTRVRYVPYRFVRPFLSEFITVEDKGDNVKNAIVHFSNTLFAVDPNRVMYRFSKGAIEISSVWKDYLQKHQAILRGFTYWHLLRFLQKNNPIVVGLPDKLFKHSERDLKQAETFWKSYLQTHSALTCIYSGQLITRQNISLDHFLPWSYVVHDQLWNIIPTPKSVNSAKNNSLPSEVAYFEKYAQLQFDAFTFHAQNGHSKLLADYFALFGQDLNSLQNQPYAWFREGLERAVLPQLQTARNMGFAYPFIYKSTD
ncbi:HNH endonuclease domain-containing protein [Rudanella lutea]|uniref:HNH endonuclease domain-containing protein n=1 Tax=Rudanella lutea TaxID=451374 RepID=UPI0003A3265C|nr:HNH endonuclease domain-containing protein [Rudanella lutea]